MEGRQWVMSRLLPQQWGEKQQIDVKNDWSLLTEEERRRKAEEVIQMIRELKEPPPQPPPLIYRPERTTEDDEAADAPEPKTGPAGNLDRRPCRRADGARVIRPRPMMMRSAAEP